MGIAMWDLVTLYGYCYVRFSDIVWVLPCVIYEPMFCLITEWYDSPQQVYVRGFHGSLQTFVWSAGSGENIPRTVSKICVQKMVYTFVKSTGIYLNFHVFIASSTEIRAYIYTEPALCLCVHSFALVYPTWSIHQSHLRLSMCGLYLLS